MGDQNKHFVLTNPETGQSWDLPVLNGTTGPDVIDVRKFYGETGSFTFDPGFTSTASCESAITFIDGDEGVLLHRGYSIEALADNCDYMEVCYLLLNGELPTQAEKDKFEHTITYHSMVHEQLTGNGAACLRPTLANELVPGT